MSTATTMVLLLKLSAQKRWKLQGCIFFPVLASMLALLSTFMTDIIEALNPRVNFMFHASPSKLKKWPTSPANNFDTHSRRSTMAET